MGYIITRDILILSNLPIICTYNLDKFNVDQLCLKNAICIISWVYQLLCLYFRLTYIILVYVCTMYIIYLLIMMNSFLSGKKLIFIGTMNEY